MTAWTTLTVLAGFHPRRGEGRRGKPPSPPKGPNFRRHGNQEKYITKVTPDVIGRTPLYNVKASLLSPKCTFF